MGILIVLAFKAGAHAIILFLYSTLFDITLCAGVIQGTKKTNKWLKCNTILKHAHVLEMNIKMQIDTDNTT